MVRGVPLKVCVVDDDDAVRDSMKLLLSAHGMSVATFSAPKCFLAKMPEIDSDCLVFDLHMPEMTGLELAERVRRLDRSTPIVIVTGRADPKLGPRMQRAGIAAVLPKPVGDTELVEAIKKARLSGKAQRSNV